MISKKVRERVFHKYGGRCAYCGCPLPHKGWQLDHKIPLKRGTRFSEIADPDMVQHWYDTVHHFDNYMPSCQSCNTLKRDMSLDAFRNFIYQLVKSLNKYSVQYKCVKRYGLVRETKGKVRFYFEKFHATGATNTKKATE